MLKIVSLLKSSGAALQAGFASALAVLRMSIKETCSGKEIDECQTSLK